MLQAIIGFLPGIITDCVMFVANLVLFWAVFKRWKWLMAPWLLLYPIGVLTNIGIGIYYFVKGKKLHTWLPVLIACKLHM